MYNLLVKDIFNDYTLNIFTDASIKEVNGYFTGTPGAIAVRTFDGIPYIFDKYTYLSYDSTNNLCEIQAVRLGINMAIRHKNNFRVINLFADSNICVSGLNEWIDGWIANSKNGVFRNNSNKYVENQNVFKSIMDDIIFNQLNIGIFHIKGHCNIDNMNPNDKHSLLYAMNTFRNINKLNASKDLIKLLVFYNNKVDDFTREFLYKHFNEKNIGKEKTPFMYKPNLSGKENLPEFKKLTNNIISLKKEK